MSSGLSRAVLSEEEERAIFRMVWWLRSHPMHRPYILYGIILAPHQRVTWRMMWQVKRMGMRLSRGLAKTMLDGLFLVDKSLLWSGASSVVLGRVFRPGKLVMKESCEKIISSNLASQEKCDFCLMSLKKPANIINKGSDLWAIEWRHGSSVVTGPLGPETGQSSAMRGVRANAALVLDEANDIGEEHYTSVISPFGRVARDPVGDLEGASDMQYTKVESGTVRYDYQRYAKYLTECEAKMIEGNPDYGVVEFNFEDCYYHEGGNKSNEIIFTYRLNLDEIFAEYNSGITSWADFLSENKNVIQFVRDQEFPPQLIDSISGVDPSIYFSVFNEHELSPLLTSPEPVVIGVDPARDSADCAFVVIRVGPLRKTPVEYSDVIYAHTMNKNEFKDMAAHLRKLLDNYPNALLVHMDKGGGGSAIRDILWRPTDGKIPLYDPNDPDTPEDVKSIGSPILRVEAATAEVNTWRGNFTKAQMESKRLLLPDTAMDFDKKDLDLAIKSIKRLGRQFTYIVVRAAGNWKKYVTGEKKLKKDLFSATLLAMQALHDVVNDPNRLNEIIEEHAWV